MVCGRIPSPSSKPDSGPDTFSPIARPPIVPPNPADPYKFSPESYWKQGPCEIIDRVEPDTFHDLFAAADAQLVHNNNNLDLRRGIVVADFVTDSVSMVQLFNVARAACRDEALPPVNLTAQFVHNKIFMRATYPADGSSAIKKDATGELVPPRCGFCERMEAAQVTTFQRVMSYELYTQSDAERGGYRILIHDDHVMEPLAGYGVHWDCRLDCRHHGSVSKHSVTVVVAKGAGQHALPPGWYAHLMTHIMPKTYFSVCERAALLRHSPGPTPEKPHFSGPAAREEIPPPMTSYNWEQGNKRELWCLNVILALIESEIRRLVPQPGAYGIQMKVRLQPSSDPNLTIRLGGGQAAAHELVFEEVVTEEKLVS